MKEYGEGDFSANLLGIQMELSSLFEMAGGEAALKLLDMLSALSKSEQELVLGSFSALLAKIHSGDLAIDSDGTGLSEVLGNAFSASVCEVEAASHRVPVKRPVLRVLSSKNVSSASHQRSKTSELKVI